LIAQNKRKKKGGESKESFGKLEQENEVTNIIFISKALRKEEIYNK